MAQVKIVTSIASHKFSYRPDELVELSDTQAESWAKSGICVIVPDEVEPESIPEPSKTRNKKAKAMALSIPVDE